jgi:hypothetical protein
MKRFFTVSIVLVLFVLMSGLSGFFIVSLTRLPGTIAHELCHYVMALVLGGNPHGFNIIPSIGPDGSYTLGSVLFNPTWWNAAPVALAPFLIAPFLVLGIAIVSKLQRPTHWLLGCFVLASCLPAAIPSIPDFVIMLSHPMSLPFGALVPTAAYLATLKLLK